ncbi:hypothetical protein [Caulobacter sp. UNC279MFTsu5.1]|uniref:hypothetical protein n=1 Tax=Caulobacter sp. UNC279MFTsu5.1 TaxID=1502775 RepID=UPI00036EB7B1|nr:hypothetical protein [Caulobacter sp. UNC279MFTsu5.1]SFK42158.1 hypothetical protein SAMN02799626_04255 [Caulobacter sp. UNC279MFTsu5.1]
MTVISFADAVDRLSVLGGEIVEVRGDKADLAGPPPEGAVFRPGEIVKLVYRAFEGRPEIRAVMYGPTPHEVGRALCRTLGRTPGELIGVAADPRNYELTWVCAAIGVAPGERLARVDGLSPTWLNLGLGRRPVHRVDLRKFKPAAPTPQSDARLDNPFNDFSGDDV